VVDASRARTSAANIRTIADRRSLIAGGKNHRRHCRRSECIPVRRLRIPGYMDRCATNLPWVSPPSERVYPGYTLTNDQRVDVVGALVGLYGLQVRHVAEDGIFVGDTVGAEDVA
jgi:hypothetical protein